MTSSSEQHLGENMLELYHHPDTLYDEAYEKVYLSPEKYTSIKDEFQVKSTSDDEATLQTSAGATFLVKAFAPGVMRIRISPDDSALKPSTTEVLGLIKNTKAAANLSTSKENRHFVFETDDFNVKLEQSTNEVSIFDREGNTLIQTTKGGFRFARDEPDYSGHSFLTFFDLVDEQIFGFGGRIMHPNRTGTTADIFSEKVGKTRGDYGGFPIPFFMSTKGYGFFLNNPWPHVYFDMGKTKQSQWFMHAPGGECDIFMIYGPEFKKIIKSYTEIVGRISLPPKWLLGFWCSSLTFTSAAEVIDDAKRLKEQGYPCDVICLDGPWRGGPDFLRQYSQGGEYPSNDINWHSDFGDGPTIINSLGAMGIRLCLHLNSRNFHPDTVASAVPKKLLRQHEEETVVDVTNKKSEDFYEGMITPRVKEGVSIWWTDHADRVSGEISKGIPSRNLFGALWNRLLSEIMARNGRNSCLSLTRGSGIGGQHYALPWPGDTKVGIDAFEEDIWFCLNAGLAGFPITSVDIGGFTLSKDPKTDYANDDEKYAETFDEDNIGRRLCQSFFFIPAPRIHNNWDTMPRLPWNCPASMQPLYKDMLKERYMLTPYIFSYALNAAQGGEPILRPLVYHHRTDNNVYDIGDEFFMGEWLLIAPVVKKRQKSRDVYLPQGKWTHLWSDKEFVGPCHIEIECPLYKIEGLPVFVKAGAIIPRQPFALSLEDAIPNQLTLDVYPDNESEFQLKESDTITNSFTCTKNKDTITLTVENNTNVDRLYRMRFHNISQFKQLLFNDKRVHDKRITLDRLGTLLTFEAAIAEKSCANIVIVTN